jgi:hypothetical protein
VTSRSNRADCRSDSGLRRAARGGLAVAGAGRWLPGRTLARMLDGRWLPGRSAAMESKADGVNVGCGAGYFIFSPNLRVGHGPSDPPCSTPPVGVYIYTLNLKSLISYLLQMTRKRVKRKDELLY